MAAATNVAFDRLCATSDVANARNALRTWKTARMRTDLTPNNIEFLDRQILAANRWLEAATAEARKL